MLKGEAKRDYQRDYMKQRRQDEALKTKIAKSNAVGMGLLDPPDNVRPLLDLVRPSRDIKTKAYSKEEQLDVRMSKKQVEKRAIFEGLKRKYDVSQT